MAQTNKQSVQIVLVSLLYLAITNAQWAVDDDGCRTPNRGVGTCVIIHECQFIINFLTNSPKPLSSETVKTLREYQCGFEGSTAKVCCPSEPVTIDDANSRITPPDVTTHKNYNLLPLKTCGPLNSDDRIIGGNKTSLFQFPWMALISYQTARGPDFRCGGTVITDRYILTAAHCITKLGTLSLLGVRVGEHDINKEVDCEQQEDEEVCAPPVQDRAIEATIPHPSYDTPPYQHDIGLIRVTRPFDLTVPNVKPVCLPVSSATRTTNYDNKNVIVTGWGATETGRKSETLLKVEIPTVPFDKCKNTYSRQANLTHRQLCAGGQNQKDSCQGDSGGPLHLVGTINKVAKFIQHGIVSFGPKLCGSEGNPGVYTKVSYYMDWILDNMKP